MSMAYDATIPLKYATFPAFLVLFDIVATNNEDAVMDSPAFAATNVTPA